MNENWNRAQLLDAYLEYAAAREKGVSDEQYFWAVEAMWAVVERDADTAWLLLLEMLRRVDGDYMIAFIAAGPLEDFLIRHGARFLERIETEARTNPKFRRALVGVWGESRMSEELVRRLRALTEGEPPL